MAINGQFLPLGQTQVVTGNGTTGVTIALTSDSPANQYDIFNGGPNTAYVRISSGAGNATASVPTVATPAYGFPIPTLTRVIRSGWQANSGSSNVTISVATTGGNVFATVYVTPGEGRG